MQVPTGQRQAPALYTAEERRRRDQSRWTLVQGILAPLQFLVFLISLGLHRHQDAVPLRDHGHRLALGT